MSAELLQNPAPKKFRLLSVLGLSRRSGPAMKAGRRVYAIGDIHGCVALLDQMHRKLVEDAAKYKGDVTIVYLGDYIDRGPDSKMVIDRLIGLRGFHTHFLKGNHEAALLDFLRDPESYQVWRNYGAPETLLSYGVRPPLFAAAADFIRARDELVGKLPQDHLRFFENLELSVSIGDYFFAHAGARPGVELEQQCEKDLIWIRDEFLLSHHDFGKVVVHGHTPQPAPLCKSNRISVDTGAYATGLLSCVVLESETQRFLQAGIGHAY
ncbi:MAG TPA: metallophosphoesterase family protein [Rhizomicrobium sp.]|nr:metallophosphoesterase family protein [Rhizomicrobium sp.]HKY17325.1 metallophosphoesterase family protein [Rhizomicrobium sp.]